MLVRSTSAIPAALPGFLTALLSSATLATAQASLLFRRRRLRRHVGRARRPAAGFPTPPSTTSRISTTAGPVRSAARSSRTASNKIIVFDVAGTIQLTAASARHQEPVQLLHRRPDRRPARSRSTATRRRSRTAAASTNSNVILRYLTFRKGTGNGEDAITFAGSDGPTCGHEPDPRPRLGLVGGGRDSLRRQQQHERHGAVFDDQRRAGEQPRLRLADSPADRFQRHVPPQPVRPQRQPPGPLRHVQRRNADGRFSQQRHLQLARPGQLRRRQQRSRSRNSPTSTTSATISSPAPARSATPTARSRVDQERRRPRVSVRQLHRLRTSS